MSNYLIRNLNNKILIENNKLSTKISSALNLVPDYKVFLDAGNSSSYPGTGTVWTNLGSATANGTINNGTYSSSGGGSILFNGSSTYVDCGSDISIADFTGMTLSTWMYITSATNNMSILYKSDNNTGAGWFQLFGTGVIGLAIVYSSTNIRNNISTTNIPLNQWFNFVSVWNGGTSYTTITNYVNGVSYAASTFDNGTGTHSTDAAQPLQIGNSRTGATAFFNGYISNVLIYNTPLNSTGVIQNFNVQKTRFGL